MLNDDAKVSNKNQQPNQVTCYHCDRPVTKDNLEDHSMCGSDNIGVRN